VNGRLILIPLSLLLLTRNLLLRQPHRRRQDRGSASGSEGGLIRKGQLDLKAELRPLLITSTLWLTEARPLRYFARLHAAIATEPALPPAAIPDLEIL
jgi:hypothetical protein